MTYYISPCRRVRHVMLLVGRDAGDLRSPRVGLALPLRDDVMQQSIV